MSVATPPLDSGTGPLDEGPPSRPRRWRRRLSHVGQDPEDAAEAVADGSMPRERFVVIHRDARLSDAERRQLIDALTRWDATTTVLRTAATMTAENTGVATTISYL